MPNQITVGTEDSALDELILNQFPYPIAIRYRLLLDETDVQRKARLCIQCFEVGLRTLTLGVISQYLVRDLSVVNNVKLNRLLGQHQHRAVSPGTWVETFFTALEGYRGHRQRFFVKELYDFYWDTSSEPHQSKRHLRPDFQRLVEIRNIITHQSPIIQAGWQKLYEEAHERLRKVLLPFAFLQEYDLIRIIGGSPDSYHYEIFTGQCVATAKGPLVATEGQQIKTGWCYLSKDRREVLRLYPLFLFHPQEMLEPEFEVDTCLYDSYHKDRIEYLAAIGKVWVTDPDIIDDFIELWLDRLEKVKAERREARRLSWHLLQEVCNDITTQRMGDARRKYRAVVYLQREEVYQAFQDFVQSDKTCLILTGGSGVGKSNFILSLLDEWRTSDTICALAYNGARLSPETTIEQVLATDFGKFVKLMGKENEGEVEDALKETDRIDGMADRRLVLFVDAINENPMAKDLLRRIDALVEGNIYPWLKVVISCRPESWKRIKRGVRLAEHKYYRRGVGKELGVELEPFSYIDTQPVQYEVRVEPFTRTELPQVYEKYRNVYKLATPYEAIPPQIKQLLRDPLVLWLVAYTYHQAKVPSALCARELIQNYLEMLIRTERLDRKDLLFLESEIVPRLFRDDHFDNSLPLEQIRAAATADGRSLPELIFNDDLLPGGRHVNQSYRNLVDAEILIELGSELDYAVGFKYERFYEFFGGRHLHMTSQAIPGQIGFYERAIAALPSHLFLWGALVQALILELAEENLALFIDLAPKAREERLLRSAMVTALTQFGEENPATAENVIRELIGPLAPPPHAFFGELWRLLRPIKEESTEVPIQQIIAVEAASRLRMTGLLEKIAADPSPRLRAVAALHTFYLWKQNPSAGFQLLDGLSHHVTGRFRLPDLGVAESMLAISGAILGQKTRDPKTWAHLLTVGRRGLRRLLLLDDLEQGKQQVSLLGRLRRIAVSFLHNQVLDTLLGFVLKMMTGWEEHATITLAHVGHVFNLSYEQKAPLRAMIPFLAPDKPGLAEQLEDMLCLEEWGDTIGATVVEMAVMSHGVVDFDATLPILKELTNAALSQKPPKFWVSGPQWCALQIALRQDNPNPELRELVEECSVAVQEDIDNWLVLAKRDRPIPSTTDSRVSCLGGPIMAAYAFQGNVESGFVKSCLERAMAAKDDEYLRLYVTNELTIIFESGLYQAALQALQLIATCESQEVKDTIVEMLVRARRYDPEMVEDLLLQGGFPAEIVERVLAYPTSERLNDLMTFQLANIVYDLFLFGPEPLRLELQWLISQALELSSMSDWLVLVTKEILNLLAGEVVFKVPDDAPSRQLL